MSACAYCGHPAELHDGPCTDPSCYCAGYEHPPTREEIETMQHIHADLRGNGAQLVHPRPELTYPGNPRRITLGRARDVVAAFQVSGHSTHSPRGELVWILIDWARENEVALRVCTHRSRVTRTAFGVTDDDVRGPVFGYRVIRLRAKEPIDDETIENLPPARSAS